VRFADSFGNVVAAHCTIVVVGVMVGQLRVWYCCLAWVEVVAALMHHTDRSFVSVAGIDMPWFVVVLEL
jgi:hypothetical protein